MKKNKIIFDVICFDLDIFDWMRIRIFSQSIKITSRNQLQFQKQSHSNLICYYKNKSNFQNKQRISAFPKIFTFQSTMRIILELCEVQDQSIAKELSLNNSNLILFQRYDDKQVIINREKTVQFWVNLKKKILIENFPQVNRNQVYTYDRKIKIPKTLILISDLSYKNEKTWLTLIQNIHYLRQTFKLHIQIYQKDKSMPLNFYHHFQINKTKLPSLALIQFDAFCNNFTIKKYFKHFSYQIITIQQIKIFLNQCSMGMNLLPLKSQLPFKNNGFFGKGSQKLIQKLTAKSFQQMLVNSSKHYVVMFTTKDFPCDQCEKALIEFKQVAAFFKGQNIVFATFDFIRNEFQLPQFEKIPTIALYKANKKNEPLIFSHNILFNVLLPVIKEEFEMIEEQYQ